MPPKAFDMAWLADSSVGACQRTELTATALRYFRRRLKNGYQTINPWAELQRPQSPVRP